MTLKYEKVTYDDVNEYFLSGWFDFRDYNTFFEIIDDIKNWDGKKIILDFNDIDGIDTTALGMLIMASEEGVAKGVKITIRNAYGFVRKVLYSFRIDKIYNLVEDTNYGYEMGIYKKKVN